MILQYHERLRKLAAHDPSLQQEYGHEVLAVRNEATAGQSFSSALSFLLAQQALPSEQCGLTADCWPQYTRHCGVQADEERQLPRGEGLAAPRLPQAQQQPTGEW